jgi:hypothetical protein
MIKLLKEKINILFNKDYLRYIELYNSIKGLKEEVYELAERHNLVKAELNNDLKGNESLSEQINERYNKFYSRYLENLKLVYDKIALFKGELDSLEKKYPEIKNIIKEKEINDFVYKKYFKSNLGYKREALPQIDKENLNSFLNLMDAYLTDYGLLKHGIFKIKDLKPTQDKIDEEKVINIINTKLKGEGKAFPYIISEDNYLLDGHHNWAADLEDDENKEVYCFKINKNIKDLINKSRRLKLLTKDSLEKSIKSIILSNEEFSKAVVIVSDFIHDIENEQEKMKIKREITNFDKFILLSDTEAEYTVVWKKLGYN